ncbi:hypothetical protein CLOSTMETH_00544 [[Clostridium] methylpentosum DSM 5476]|uniref:Uncharacterized protein n=1 Tax=[Clostridium] methylpentosum DSM 5476 TaxID=537013 RepID=C0E9P5_9FIRM|nr:hypothetical protein CLOSTMETH_00544 [[Clostridium] methylpentosum DSM 5476]
MLYSRHSTFLNGKINFIQKGCPLTVQLKNRLISKLIEKFRHKKHISLQKTNISLF